MLTQPKILVWGAYKLKKNAKTGFRNAADVSSKSYKNQNKGERDLKYGSK